MSDAVVPQSHAANVAAAAAFGLPFFNAEVAAAAHFLTSGALAPPLRPLLLPETAAPPPGKWPACR